MFVSRSTMKKIVVTTVLGVSLISSALAGVSNFILPNGPNSPSMYRGETFTFEARNTWKVDQSVVLGSISEQEDGSLISLRQANISDDFLAHKPFLVTVIMTPGLSKNQKGSSIPTQIFQRKNYYYNLDVINFNLEDGNWVQVG